MSYKVDCLSRVKNDWYHKWASLPGTRLFEYVKGPLNYPLLAVPIPCIMNDDAEKDGCEQCNCVEHIKECYSKPGIPDPWDELLIVKQESEKGKNILSEFPKRDIDITDSLKRQYRIYLGQGIPDPWKKWVTLEPTYKKTSFENVKKEMKKFLSNLRTGPGRHMYETEKVCCPNCNRQLIVLCLRKEYELKPTDETEEDDSEPGPSGQKEENNIPKKTMKDASVETDKNFVNPEINIKNEQNEGTSNKEYSAEKKEVKNSPLPEKCSCKLNGFCACQGQSKCAWCPVCRPEEKKTKVCLCKNQRDIKKHEYRNTVRKNRRRNSRCDLQSNGPCTHFIASFPQTYNAFQKCLYNEQQLNMSTQHTHCQYPCQCHRLLSPTILLNGTTFCPPQQFIGFGRKFHHCCELKLVCPTCERKGKKKRKGNRKGDFKSVDASKKEYFPCLCDEGKRTREVSPQHPCFCNQNINEIENRSIFYEINKLLKKHGDKTGFIKSNVINKGNLPVPSSGRRCIRRPTDNNFRNTFDADYLHLLEVLGLLERFQNKQMEHNEKEDEFLPKYLNSTPRENMKSVESYKNCYMPRNFPSGSSQEKESSTQKRQDEFKRTRIPVSHRSFHSFKYTTDEFRNMKCTMRKRGKNGLKKDLRFFSNPNGNCFQTDNFSSTSESDIQDVTNPRGKMNTDIVNNIRDGESIPSPSKYSGKKFHPIQKK